MKGEINREWYCSADAYKGSGGCDLDFGGAPCYVFNKACGSLHRKYPTPEQFRQEYTCEWKGAVYYRSSFNTVWMLEASEGNALHELSRFYPSSLTDKTYSIICACTLWGKPPDGWRPECPST